MLDPGVEHDEQPPRPNTFQATWGKVIAAAALEGITARVTRATVERAVAKGWFGVTGHWPGEQTVEPEPD